MTKQISRSSARTLVGLLGLLGLAGIAFAPANRVLAAASASPTPAPKPMQPAAGSKNPATPPSATPGTPAPAPAHTAAPTPASTPAPAPSGTAKPAATPPAATPPAPPTKPTPPPGPPAPVHYTLAATGLPVEGMWKCDPVMRDVNGDNHVDLAALPRLGKGPRVWLGNSTGTWKESSAGLTPGDRSCGGGLDFVDVNADGKLDLIVADHCQGGFVYLGDGQGSWNMVTKELFPKEMLADETSETQTMMRQGAEDIAAGDVNGDGKIDLILGGSDRGGINLYLGDGSGSTWTHALNTGLPSEDWANRVILADMNGDGHLDIVAAFATGPRVWLNDGKGLFTLKDTGLASPIVKGLYTGLGVGDINQDGRPDIAIANWVDGPEVYLQQADGTWQKVPDVFPQMLGGSIGLALGDLDGDGKLDMVVSGRLEPTPGYVRGVFALLGDGKGAFRYLPDSGLPTTGLGATAGVAIGDATGDGVPDIAAGSGLIVETVDDGPKEPAIPQRLLVWAGQKVGK